MVKEDYRGRPLISVVMPVYNGEHYLREAIDSILDQTFTDFEFIIIDDGSTDRSAKIIRGYNDARIRFVRQDNAGLPAALNKGIELSSGKYIARMDADDISYPERLFIQFNYLRRNPDVVVLGGAAILMDEGGNDICKMIPPISGVDIKNKLPETPFIHPSVVFLKQCFFEAGRYPESLKYAPEDAALFNKMSKLGVFANIPQPLIGYRLTPQSLSLRNGLNKKLLDRAVRKELDGTLTETECLVLERKAKNIPLQMKKAAYYSLLAKKYLWDNPQPKKSMVNFVQSIALYPWWLSSYLLLIVSVMVPNKWIVWVYRRLKG